MDHEGKEVHVVGWSGTSGVKRAIREEMNKGGGLPNEILADPLKDVTQYENHAERTALATIKANVGSSGGWLQGQSMFTW